MSLKTKLLTKFRNRPVVSEDIRDTIYPDLKSLETSITNLQTGSSLSLTWTSYSSTSTIVGWSSSTKILNYCTVGKLMFVQYSITGPSDSTSTSFTLPSTANGTQAFSISVVKDNSTF